jgi:hypothetical protein
MAWVPLFRYVLSADPLTSQSKYHNPKWIGMRAVILRNSKRMDERLYENMRKKLADLSAKLFKENPVGSPKENDMITVEAKAIEWITLASYYSRCLDNDEYVKDYIGKLDDKIVYLTKENEALRNQIRELDSELAARSKNSITGNLVDDEQGQYEVYEDLELENMTLKTKLKKAMDELKFLRNADRIIGSDLTDSEVIQRLNQGKSIREISRELGIPYSTVRRIASEKRSK